MPFLLLFVYLTFDVVQTSREEAALRVATRHAAWAEARRGGGVEAAEAADAAIDPEGLAALHGMDPRQAFEAFDVQDVLAPMELEHSLPPPDSGPLDELQASSRHHDMWLMGWVQLDAVTATRRVGHLSRYLTGAHRSASHFVALDSAAADPDPGSDPDAGAALPWVDLAHWTWSEASLSVPELSEWVEGTEP